MTDRENPLLKPSPLPHGVPPFDKIREEDYLPAVEASIAEARRNVEKIKNDPAPATFNNTLLAMENSQDRLGEVTSIFYNQLSAVGGDGLHELAEKIGPICAEFSSDILLDEGLFARMKAVHDAANRDGLTPEERTLLDDSYKGFVRGGALLGADAKQRLREISQRLSVLGPIFMNNVTKSAEAFELLIDNENDLSGLPDSAREAAAFAAKEAGHDGQWLFSLDFPSYGPFMQFSENRTLREKMWRAFGGRAWGGDYDNAPVVKEIVRLRNERARLLGYENHAALVLEERMAEAPHNVLDFLDKLKVAYKPAAIADLKSIRSFAESHGLEGELKPWDVGYYSEKLRQAEYNFSSEDLRPYFPLHTVLNGCFEHFSRLFGLRFTVNTSYPVWHEDVTAYDVTDESDGRFIGILYADFFPRTGKKDGAWKTSYRDQGLSGGKVERPIVAIVCNFTKPTPEKPALLTHGEVLTLFHEMGHAVHGLLSDITYSSLAGTNVKWDFVELPSQVQENWVYERETLDLVSGHYQTGEKLPGELIDKMIAAKNFMAGWTGLRQVNFAILDMAWHTSDPDAIDDVGVFEDEVTADTSLFPRLAGPHSAAFSHLFAGGYGAGYYSYKWAEVLDADTFELFLERGLYHRETADAYRREILSRGGSEHPRLLYQRFRGRDADPDALLRREGLTRRDEAA